MPEENFRLQIETHAETQLLQTVALGPQHTVQIVSLFEHFYLLERLKGERRLPLKLESAELAARLQQGERLGADELRSLLPPTQSIDIVLAADDSLEPSDGLEPIQALLRQAMNRFVSQNPQTAEALRRDSQAAQAQYRSQRAQSELSSTGPNNGSPAADTRPYKTPTPEPSPADTAPSHLAVLPSASEPLELLTSPLVQQALQQASENQQKLLLQAQVLQKELQTQTEQAQSALNRLPHFQAQVNALRQRLENWQTEMERHHLTRDHLLARTAQELTALQAQLKEILSQGLTLKKLVREQRFRTEPEMDDRLECLEDMLDQVVQQRHWIHYLQQQQAFRALEQERVQHVRRRLQGLKKQIAALKQRIAVLEQINQDILSADPLCVPEPVPAMVLHELTRLEQERQILESDPALNLLEDA